MNARSRAVIGARLVDGVMVVMVVAGILKAFDITVFAESLATWSLLPNASRPVLAVGIPALEIGLSLAWFMGVWRRLALSFTILLLSAFTLAYITHLVLAEAPECACFGLLNLMSKSIEESRMLIVRNVVLISLLVTAAVLLHKSSRNRDDSPTDLRRPV